jgi:hypothetical protein
MEGEYSQAYQHEVLIQAVSALLEKGSSMVSTKMVI